MEPPQVGVRATYCLDADIRMAGLARHRRDTVSGTGDAREGSVSLFGGGAPRGKPEKWGRPGGFAVWHERSVCGTIGACRHAESRLLTELY